MKVIIVLCLLGYALAAPSPATYTANSKTAEIVRYENDNTGFGPFRFAYEQSDGTKHEQQGEVIDEGRENQRLVVKGKYTFVAPDDVVYVVRYVADENGYQPEIEKGGHDRKIPEVSDKYVGRGISSGILGLPLAALLG